VRLVICGGVQYDADKLPASVDASKCVPADQWFAENRKPPKAPAAAAESEPTKPAPKKRRARRSKD
jgi:hypothetical protein